jgi:exosortase F-associated protein
MLFIHNRTRWILSAFAICLLTVAYLFQRFDFSSLLGNYSPNARFILNKSFRFIVNDIACLLLIGAIFNKPGYLRISTIFFIAEMFILLPLYFVLKLNMEGDSEISSPLLSQLHRMIVNPLLMIILLMGFFYQDYFSKKPA